MRPFYFKILMFYNGINLLNRIDWFVKAQYLAQVIQIMLFQTAEEMYAWQLSTICVVGPTSAWLSLRNMTPEPIPDKGVNIFFMHFFHRGQILMKCWNKSLYILFKMVKSMVSRKKNALKMSFLYKFWKPANENGKSAKFSIGNIF